MGNDVSRSFRLPVIVAILLGIGAVALCLPRAIHHKQVEYEVGRILEASGLDAFDQAVMMTAVHRRSDFDLDARANGDRAGLLLLEASEARDQGLAIEDGAARSHEGPLRRWFALPPTAAATAADQRLDARSSLEAGTRIFRARKQRWESMLASGDPSLRSPRLASFLTLFDDPDDLPLVDRLLTEPALRESLLAAGDDPPSEWAEAVSLSPILETPNGQALRRRMLGTAVYVEAFGKILPRIQSRPGPGLVEYFNSLKGVLVQIFGVEKWVMHLVLGAVVFCLVAGGANLLLHDSRRAGRLAWALVFVLAVVVEIVDWYDAVLNDKVVTWGGSFADIVVTCAIPTLILAWARSKGTRGARAEVSSDATVSS